MNENNNEKLSVIAIPKDTVNDILNEVKEKNYNSGFLAGYFRGNRKGYFSGFAGGMAFAGALLVAGIGLGAAGGYLIDKIEEALNEEEKDGSESV